MLQRAGQKRRGLDGSSGVGGPGLGISANPRGLFQWLGQLAESSLGGLSGTHTLEVWGRGLDLVGSEAQVAGVAIAVGQRRVGFLPGAPLLLGLT